MMKSKILVLFTILFVIPSSVAFSLELIEADPSPIVASDYADVTLRFTNSEKEGFLSDAKLTVAKTEFITPVSGEAELTKVFSGESITRTFRIFFSEDLPQGFIDIPIDASFDESEVTTDIRVFVKDAQSNPELNIGEIVATPNELLPDTDDNKLTVKLQNLGDKDAELVKAELVVEDDSIKPSFSFSFSDSVATIAGGDEEEFEFDLDIEANVNQEVPAMLKLKYRAEKSVGDSYETFEEQIPFNIPITDAPLLIVESVEQIDDFAIGTTENKFRITIRNDGREDAEEVRIRVVPDISYPLVFERTTQYVTSKIEPGKSGRASRLRQ